MSYIQSYMYMGAQAFILQRFIHLFSQQTYLGRVHSTAPSNDDALTFTPTFLNDFHDFLLPRDVPPVRSWPSIVFPSVGDGVEGVSEPPTVRVNDKGKWDRGLFP